MLKPKFKSKSKSKKIISTLLVVMMSLSVAVVYAAADNPDWEQPSWTALHEDGTPFMQFIDEYGNRHDLPTWSEAHAIDSPVIINGVEYNFEAYTIGGFNHFRLRDLAYVLNGTEAQFDIYFDGSTNAAHILRGQSYTPVGGEMTSRTLANPHAPMQSQTNFIIDGVSINISAYNIEGNNFFRLRDMGALLDFSVEWVDGRIVIDTSAGYTSPTGSIANYFNPGPATGQDMQDMSTVPMFRFVGTRRAEGDVTVEHSLDGGQTWISGGIPDVTIPATNNLPREYIIEQKQIWIDAGRDVPDWLMTLYNNLD